MYDRWQRNGLAAIPEDMDCLQSQMRGADMNIAMLLTWNYMATKFNEQLETVEKDMKDLQEKCNVYKRAYNYERGLTDNA